MLIIDIETRRDGPGLKRYNEVVRVKVPKQYKKEESIARFEVEQIAKRHEQAALLPWTGRIVAIAFGKLYYKPSGGDEKLVCDKKIVVNLDPAGEPDLIRSFWEMAEGTLQFIGYNILGFDIPFIVLRSMIHDVKPTRSIGLARYKSCPVYDLMQLLAGWDMKKVVKLDVACELLGIENPLPGVDGSQVENMDEDMLIEYGKAEIDKIFRLYERMEPFYG